MTALSLRNPIAILMLSIAVIVFSAVVTPRMSVDTFPELTPPVLVVGSFAELETRSAEARGRIVLFDVPFTEYRQTVAYRGTGAVAAARHGAVAMLLRSVASFSMNSPHTGGMRYDSTVTKIPAAAITVEDAMLLHRLQNRGVVPTVHLTMSARTLPDAPSRNIVAELRGRELPDEIVVMGGHIDSWDVGQGAMDDAGGVVAAWEALRLMKQLGLRPRRTIRVVGWTNEENGTRGGQGYRAAHAAEVERHVFALESDNGAFKPSGIAAVGTDSALAMLRRIAPLLARIGASTVTRGGGEADIGPLLAAGVPGAGLEVDGTRYFWYHHTDADTPDKLNPAEVAQCVAVMAVYAYVLAEMPERLPRSK